MRAFVAQFDPAGLRRLTPEHLLPADELGRLASRRTSRQTSLAWALLADDDAESLRAELAAGRHRQACGLLLDLAVEIVPIEAALAGSMQSGS